MIRYRNHIITVLVLLLTACGHSPRSIMNSLMYRKIDYLSGGKVLTDSVERYSPVKAQIKIVSYVDSLVCTRCLANYLNAASEYVDSFNTDSVIYLCVLQKRSIEETQNMINQVNIKNVVVINDAYDHYLEKNKIDRIPALYTSFLLNSNDEIVSIGDPLRNLDIRLLFDKRIRGLIENGGENLLQTNTKK